MWLRKYHKIVNEDDRIVFFFHILATHYKKERKKERSGGGTITNGCSRAQDMFSVTVLGGMVTLQGRDALRC